jgi:hypothetical protein
MASERSNDIRESPVAVVEPSRKDARVPETKTGSFQRILSNVWGPEAQTFCDWCVTQ